MVQLGNDWDALLAPEFEQEYYKKQMDMFLMNH